MVKSVLFCFRCQMCFESSVSFEYFLCVKDLIWIFKCAWSHAYVVLSVVCVACADGCLVYNIFVHALILQWTCFLVPTVTVVCTNDLCLVFSNYARVVICDYWPNVIHTTVTDFNCVPIKKFCVACGLLESACLLGRGNCVLCSS